MSVNYLVYKLEQGYIQNWLVAGPQATDIRGLISAGDEWPVVVQKARERYHDTDSRVVSLPVDQESLRIGEEELAWNYTRCHEDHLVDVSGSYPGPVYLRTWAFAQVKTSLPGSLPVTFELTTPAAADIWLNGHLVFQKAGSGPDMETVSFQTELAEENELLVRFEMASPQDALNVMALRLAGPRLDEVAEKLTIELPTQARFPTRQQQLERIFEKAYLEEVVNTRGAKFNLRWAEDLHEQIRYAYQVQDMRGSIYVEGTWDTEDKNPLDIGHGYRLYERPFQVVLKAPPKEFFEQGLRYQRSLPLHVLDNAYSDMPYSSYGERRVEALKDALKHETQLYSEIAKLELDKDKELKADLILNGIARVGRGDNDSLNLLMGLLILLVRYGQRMTFPEALKEAIGACILNFDYRPGWRPLAESEEILLAACEIVAGQLNAQQPFQDGQTGAWHQAHGESVAATWLKQRGQYGFMEWNSNAAYEVTLLALAQLTSLAESTEVAEMAAILLDKMLFMLAINTYKGAMGVSHGRTGSSMIKSAQLEATSGVTRMLWGLGVYNHHILGTVGLACSDYEFPSFFADLATAAPDECWGKEHARFGEDGVNLVTYKTPDYMLSSAQDYHAGQKGKGEHILQATFGPETVVFINHPTGMKERPGRLSGFWLGNGCLPRVAQWKDTLVAVFKLAEDDWLGFTHAFFPIYQFDEYSFKNQWAFARKGDGYIAITAARGIEHVWRGPDGYRELRSYGRENTWLIQMGRRALDGGFGDFRLKVLRSRLTWHESGVSYQSPRQQQVDFGWDSPLMLDGIEQPITGFKHIENPYGSADLPARQIEVGFGETLLRLNFD